MACGFLDNIKKILSPDMPTLKEGSSLWQKSVRFLVTGGRVFFKNRCIAKSGFLAYVTLLEIFPLIAVLIYLVPVFFGPELREAVQNTLFQAIMPVSTGDLEKVADDFLAGTKTKGALSLVGLLVFSVVLFYTVEFAFCEIWGVKSRRSFLRSSAMFTGVIVWVPISVGLSLYFLNEFSKLGTMPLTIKRDLPYILFFLSLTLGYFYIPNTQVRILNAAIGAFVATILWILVRALVVTQIHRFVILDTLIEKAGSIPYLLIWLFSTWIVILIGIVVTYCAQNFKSLLIEDLSIRYELIDPTVLLSILYIIGDNFVRGKGEVDYTAIRNSLPIQTPNLITHLNYLEKKGYIYINQQEMTYLMRTSPQNILVYDLFNLNEKTASMFHYIEGDPKVFFDSINSLDCSLKQVLQEKSLEEFLSTRNKTAADATQ